MKSLVARVPYYPGRLLGYIPFRLKLGKYYSLFKKRATSKEPGLDELIGRLNEVYQNAQTLPWYKKFYENHVPVINSIRDWESLPLLTKENARDLYSSLDSNGVVVTTGGTTGSPLALFQHASTLPKEWAFMHSVWETCGYSSSSILLTALGKDIGDRYFKWHTVNNEYLVSPNLDSDQGFRMVGRLIRKRNLRYFQGYPSNIFKILKGIERLHSDADFKIIRNTLRVLFLSSEATPNHMIKYFRNVWKLDLITWYGHSEACVFAHDIGCNNEYTVKRHYGFVEENEGVLIATSFDNPIMPLIRYKTDDLIKPLMKNQGIIETFTIEAGRIGEFIVDLHGRKVSLTTVLFGKHHKIFECADHVQIAQLSKGHLKFLVSGYRGESMDLSSYFDVSGLSFIFEYEKLEHPIRTRRGKIKSLVKFN